MKLENAEKLAYKLMKEHCLIDWSFKFDNAVSRFGSCRHSKKLLTLSRNLVLLNHHHRVKNTILHEIAHALVGPGNGHNWVWCHKALEIGCDGNRCYSTEKVTAVVPKLSANCSVCNRIFFKHKKSQDQRKCPDCYIKFYHRSTLYYEKSLYKWQRKVPNSENVTTFSKEMLEKAGIIYQDERGIWYENR